MTVDAREARDECGAVATLELVEVLAVDQTRDDIADVVGPIDVERDQVVEVGRRPTGVTHDDRLRARRGGKGRDDVAHDLKGVIIVVGEVVHHPGALGVESAPAEVLGGHHLADRRLDQRWTAEEDRALVSHDHRLVAHRGHIGTAGGTRAENGGDLRDAGGRQSSLGVEDAPEVVAIGKDLILHRQVCAAGVDEVDARQSVLPRYLLCAQMLLHRHREVGAALHGRVVADDHDVATVDEPDPGDHARGRRDAVVQSVRRQRRHFQERAAEVQQAPDALARQQLPA